MAKFLYRKNEAKDLVKYLETEGYYSWEIIAIMTTINGIINDFFTFKFIAAFSDDEIITFQKECDLAGLSEIEEMSALRLMYEEQTGKRINEEIDLMVKEFGNAIKESTILHQQVMNYIRDLPEEEQEEALTKKLEDILVKKTKE